MEEKREERRKKVQERLQRRASEKVMEADDLSAVASLAAEKKTRKHTKPKMDTPSTKTKKKKPKPDMERENSAEKAKRREERAARKEKKERKKEKKSRHKEKDVPDIKLEEREDVEDARSSIADTITAPESSAMEHSGAFTGRDLPETKNSARATLADSLERETAKEMMEGLRVVVHKQQQLLSTQHVMLEDTMAQLHVMQKQIQGLNDTLTLSNRLKSNEAATLSRQMTATLSDSFGELRKSMEEHRTAVEQGQEKHVEHVRQLLQGTELAASSTDTDNRHRSNAPDGVTESKLESALESLHKSLSGCVKEEVVNLSKESLRENVLSKLLGDVEERLKRDILVSVRHETQLLNASVDGLREEHVATRESVRRMSQAVSDIGLQQTALRAAPLSAVIRERDARVSEPEVEDDVDDGAELSGYAPTETEVTLETQRSAGIVKATGDSAAALDEEEEEEEDDVTERGLSPAVLPPKPRLGNRKDLRQLAKEQARVERNESTGHDSPIVGRRIMKDEPDNEKSHRTNPSGEWAVMQQDSTQVEVDSSKSAKWSPSSSVDEAESPARQPTIRVHARAAAIPKVTSSDGDVAKSLLSGPEKSYIEDVAEVEEPETADERAEEEEEEEEEEEVNKAPVFEVDDSTEEGIDSEEDDRGVTEDGESDDAESTSESPLESSGFDEEDTSSADEPMAVVKPSWAT